MSTATSFLPLGQRQIGIYLCIHGAHESLEFYKKAFAAEVMFALPSAEGKIGHAEIQIGDTRISLSDQFADSICRSPRDLGGSGTALMLKVDDVDNVAMKLISAGAKILGPIQNHAWGMRIANFVDPFGHQWMIASSIK